MGPKSDDRCLIGRGKDTRYDEGQVKTEAEPGELRPRATEPVETLEAGRGLEPWEGASGLLTPWCQTSGLQNGERAHFCCFKPPGLR